MLLAEQQTPNVYMRGIHREYMETWAGEGGREGEREGGREGESERQGEREEGREVEKSIDLHGQISVSSRNSVCPCPDSFLPMEAAETNSRMFG